jgi:hypothetical protein
MAPTRSAGELRRFGLTVGGIFALLALISWWRGHVLPPSVMGALGVTLVGLGLAAPSALAPVEHYWMRGARVLGEVNARIILTVLFYVVIFPVGWVLRRFRDPLDRSLADGRASTWIRREAGPVDPARYEQQF